MTDFVLFWVLVFKHWILDTLDYLSPKDLNAISFEFNSIFRQTENPLSSVLSCLFVEFNLVWYFAYIVSDFTVARWIIGSPSVSECISPAVEFSQNMPTLCRFRAGACWCCCAAID